MASRVLNMPFNALALPHKTIIVAQSLVEFCRGERDQMAFVVAHELAHIHLGHASERSRAGALTTMLRMGHPLLGNRTPNAVLTGPSSREQEIRGGPHRGYHRARQAGYAPDAGAKFLARLRTLDQSTGVWQVLSTHPTR